MVASVKLLALSALFGLSSAVQIVVKNQCGSNLQVGQLTNGQSQASYATVNQGASKTYPLDDHWQGRFWARENCQGDACPIAGAASPASLAEFTFKGHAGQDYYDISFVDGFNLPVSITPINPQGGGSGDQYSCGAPACRSLPSCPDDLKVYDGDRQVGCFSACSRFNTDEYCCAGAFGTPDKCSMNSYSQAVEDVCPEAYSYAYDDHTSTYICKADGYTITFCP